MRTLTGYLMTFKQGTEKARPTYSWEISEDLRTITVTASTRLSFLFIYIFLLLLFYFFSFALFP